MCDDAVMRLLDHGKVYSVNARRTCRHDDGTEMSKSLENESRLFVVTCPSGHIHVLISPLKIVEKCIFGAQSFCNSQSFVSLSDIQYPAHKFHLFNTIITVCRERLV